MLFRSFADYGEDALVVGHDGAASMLSRVVSIDGQLYSLDIERDGSSFSYEPYAGEAGVLDVCSKFESKAKLAAAIVVSSDGNYSFSLAKAKSGLRVPAGDYKLLCGQLVLGDAKAQLRTGRSKPIHVTAGEQKITAWGGPVKAEFAFKREGESVAFTPWDIWYYGYFGEEYSTFLPLGKSPEFAIKEKNTGDLIVLAHFPGNC